MTKGKPNNWRDKEFSRLKRVRDADWYWWVDKRPRKRRRKRMSKQSELESRMQIVAEIKEIATADWEVNTVKTAFINDILHRALEKYAAHLLKVAEKCSFDAYTNEGIKIRVVMLEDLENYINQEGGDGQA